MDPLIAQLVSQQLGTPPADPAAAAAGGVAPDAAAIAAAQVAAQGSQQPAAQKADPRATATEKAVREGATKDAGDEDPFEFIEIDGDDGNKRQLTKKQIKSTLERYSKLNHRWQSEVAPMSPVLDTIKSMLAAAEKSGYKAKPEEVAEFVQSAIAAFVQNPQMGNKGPAAEAKADAKPAKAAMSAPAEGDGDNDLSDWEKTNAVTLPPGYRAQMTAVKDMGSKLDQIMALLSQAQNPTGASTTEREARAGQSEMAALQTAVNTNLERAMTAVGLSQEDSQDFMNFSMMRGYSPEDFIDPALAKTVVADFKANRDAPEIGRLREIAQRRQAFTGSGVGAPAGAAGAAPKTSGDPMFDQLANAAVTNMRR